MRSRWSRRLGSPAAVLLAGAFFIAGCGSSARDANQTYSVAEARAAFSDFDLQVVVEKPPGANLRPASGEPIRVVVETSDETMDQAWITLAPFFAADGGFAARRANVAVTPDIDASISPELRTRVLAALDALPDRGEQVEVATP